MSQIKPVTVSIMGSEYHVSSPEDQIEKLEAAARNLDKRMREIKSGGRIVGVERIAVMAALNLCYEMLSNDSGDSRHINKINTKIKSLYNEIDSALASDA